VVGDVKVDALPSARCRVARAQRWIVFQFFQLLQTLTAVENVMLPMDFCNAWRGPSGAIRAETLLA